MPTVCSNCGGTDIEYDGARGDSVCTGCGTVLEDNIIVSEVTFQEQSSGSSSLVGQFVSNESSSGARGSLSGAGFHHGLGRDSREITLQHAKKRLNHLGNLLKLNQRYIDTAFGFFKMALQLNLTRGRKSSIMDTACLYLVCRSEGLPHMLLDFSDVLQINVYSLGRAYLRLSTALHISPPAIDPCLYIHRFAHKLELGDKVHEVSMTALRLVARMKRDWIHHGRRPAGLCGASLLVASRIHNFNRSVKEVARVVRLSQGTIRKRLGDFKDTPSSRLSIEEFLKIDLEQEHDPPCFLEAKKKAKIQSGNTATDGISESGLIDGNPNDESVEGDEEGVVSGFGGIKATSVEEIIAKARVAEAFLKVPSAGLSGSLSELAELAEDGEEETVDESREGVASTSNSALPQENNGELNLDGISDGEIEMMLLSEEEVKIKTQLWFTENADFLKELEVKKERQAALLADKNSKAKKKPAKKKVKRNSYQTPATTAGEAIERMLVEKKISSKINYDVLRDLDKSWQGGLPATTNQCDKDQTKNNPSITESSSNVPTPLPSGTPRLPSLRKRDNSICQSRDLPPSKISKVNNSVSQTEHDLLKVSEEILQSTTIPAAIADEIVEESGPIQYDNDEDNEDDDVVIESDEEDRWGDLGMDDMGYEGDPLLNSDYEDD